MAARSDNPFFSLCILHSSWSTSPWSTKPRPNPALPRAPSTAASARFALAAPRHATFTDGKGSAKSPTATTKPTHVIFAFVMARVGVAASLVAPAMLEADVGAADTAPTDPSPTSRCNQATATLRKGPSR
ncbi:Aste57867_8554 [Aphanomyces stellatus]|uniref:Aste57867_8554 protein n=1 Tax=Aphanomyces stellatus TaxID=120398 RepID=A0A485KKP3_9STRA|nr:hypothetical protein As57867_008522 [Aphanomyces stellatus]VFT85440.1 Aste57867_8554 [Aphanomyces stellatus]